MMTTETELERVPRELAASPVAPVAVVPAPPGVSITVPGDIPGLLRPFAPCRRDDLCGDKESQAVVLRVSPKWYGGLTPVYFMPTAPDCRLSHGEQYKFLHLDLSARVGRDVAAHWMAEQLGHEIGLTSPMFEWSGQYRCWSLSGPGWQQLFAGPSLLARNGHDHRMVISDLPLDPTKGIEAMRVIVLHLAGRLP